MLRTIMLELGDGSNDSPAMEAALWLGRAFGARLSAITCLDERQLQALDIRCNIPQRALPAEETPAGSHEGGEARPTSSPERAPDTRGLVDAWLEGGPTHDPLIRRMLTQHVWAARVELAARCREVGVEFEHCVEVGDPSEVLARRSRGADLSVLRRPPRQGALTDGLRSPAASVVRAIERDALYVGDTTPAFHSVVVGYAGHDTSCDALELAAHIVEKAEGTVHVVTSRHHVGQASELLSLAEEYLGAYRLEVVGHHCSGEPASAILRIAAQVSADTVALGAHRHGKLHQLALGSTALHILSTTPLSVLICR